jgi:hypothetical protein
LPKRFLLTSTRWSACVRYGCTRFPHLIGGDLSALDGGDSLDDGQRVEPYTHDPFHRGLGANGGKRIESEGFFCSKRKCVRAGARALHLRLPPPPTEATSLRISGVRHALGSHATWMKGMFCSNGAHSCCVFFLRFLASRHKNRERRAKFFLGKQKTGGGGAQFPHPRARTKQREREGRKRRNTSRARRFPTRTPSHRRTRTEGETPTQPPPPSATTTNHRQKR